MENNMVVKLKIPQEAGDLRFDCPECGRSFATGKGLGAHRRVHNRNRDEAIVPEIETPPFSCPVCRQAFSSEKALHGHMRKHPDRTWRGMRPPSPPEEENPLAIVPVDNDLVALANAAQQLPPDGAYDSDNRFVCDMCGKAFKSYHALGGHKSHHSRHRKSTARNDQPSVETPPLMLTFDLNELPPECSGYGGE